MTLLAEIDDGRLGPERIETVVRAANRHPDNRVRDLYERFLPEEERVRRLGTDVNLDELASQTGDASRGRALFMSNELSCRNCHPLDGVGQRVGPDLRDVGRRYRKREILEQIVYPSKSVDEQFQLHQVETGDGRVLVGLLVQESAEQVTLRDAGGKDHIVARGEIEFRSRAPKSLMPEQQLSDLTAQQAADLLEFLASLRKSES